MPKSVTETMNSRILTAQTRVRTKTPLQPLTCRHASVLEQQQRCEDFGCGRRSQFEHSSSACFMTFLLLPAHTSPLQFIKGD